MKAYRSFVAVLLAVLVLLSCTACGNKPAASEPAPTENAGQNTEPAPTEPKDEGTKFPAGTKIFGTEVAELTAQEAFDLIASLTSAYAIEARVNDSVFYIKGEDVLLTVSLEDIAAYMAALQNSPTAKAPEAKLDSALLRQKIAEGTGSSVVDAKVSYNKSSQSFTISEAKAGVSVDTYEAAKVIEPAMLKLEPSASVTVKVQETEPAVKTDDPRLKAAADKANAFLKVSLTYVYAPEQVAAKSQAVTKNDIGGMIAFDGAMDPYINMTAVNKYAASMNDKYCVRGKYQTPDGVTMPGFGPILQAVDVQGLSQDIKSCLEKGISGTRNAPYNPRVEQEEGQLADCVIVNLSAQHLYVYDKAGACVVSTPIVSGCVYNDTETITGVFHIYAKSRNVTLSGPGYASPVKYWMPFSGGYGLHDADWRSSFGGEIYLYDGSHGCVNIPPAVAGTVYENVSIGTPVVIYGGTTSVKERPQNLEAVTSYKLSDKTAPFNLNVSALGEPVLTYTSSNPEVAEVAADGTVTIKGLGKTTITVVAPAHAVTTGKPGAYLEGTLDITIEVLEGCGAGHSLVWEITKEPSCAEGEMTGTCSACGYTETKAIEPSKEHSYGEFATTTEPTCGKDGEKSATCAGCGDVKTEPIPMTGNHAFTAENEFCGNGCGTKNPGYVPPATDSTENP